MDRAVVTTPPSNEGFEQQDMPPRARRSRLRLDRTLEQLAGPLAGALLTGVLAADTGLPLEAGLIAFVTLLTAGTIAGRRSSVAALLPFMDRAARAAGPLVGVVVLAVAEATTGLLGLSPLGLVAVAVVAVTFTILGAVLADRLPPDDRHRQRVALIGSARAADSLQRELTSVGPGRYVIVGRISPPGEEVGEVAEEVRTLGALDSLGELASRHRIDLLLMTGEVPRLAVFDEISRSCLHLPIRLQELTGFYEGLFGHVPVAEINASWFQYIIHPSYHSGAPAAKRALDLFLCLLIAVATLPLLAVFALIIRYDGGPAFFRQLRIGEGGVPFSILKLRTMHVGASNEWASADDARVTALGRMLRRTHLDELPQILNVLRGDMSIVGPRPEQPEFVEKLEQTVPFYSRRHLIKPGITGWAQVRCGYAGSELGSAWKVSHDLYYLKHRSFRLDLLILGETLRAALVTHEFAVDPGRVYYVLRDEPEAPEGPPVAPPIELEASAERGT